LALPETLHEFVHFGADINSISSTLIFVPSNFLLPLGFFSDFNRLVSRLYWSFFSALQETIAKTDNRPINIDVFIFFMFNIYYCRVLFLSMKQKK
jgi:hypothetical protein